jgi:hypothetical protein
VEKIVMMAAVTAAAVTAAAVTAAAATITKTSKENNHKSLS